MIVHMTIIENLVLRKVYFYEIATKWYLLFPWIFLSLNLMATADIKIYMIMLMTFLKLNHPDNHGITPLGNHV